MYRMEERRRIAYHVQRASRHQSFDPDLGGRVNAFVVSLPSQLLNGVLSNLVCGIGLHAKPRYAV